MICNSEEMFLLFCLVNYEESCQVIHLLIVQVKTQNLVHYISGAKNEKITNARLPKSQPFVYGQLPLLPRI
jgi:hypothetical protein